MHEIEIKLRVDDPADARARLAAAGAEPHGPRQFEDNRLYDDDRESLRGGHRILRLRSTGGRHLVTYKEPLPESPGDARYKIRIEHETSVGDAEAFEQVLFALGYHRSWRYQKFRESFRLAGVHVELDETPIGTFVELEGPPDAIERAAAALGYAGRDYITKSYHELASDHRVAGDLVFDPPVRE